MCFLLFVACTMNSFIRHLKIEFLGSDFSDVRSEPFEDILASEAAQALREGLGPIDIDELNMLADPGFVQLDPQAEDTFRLDKLWCYFNLLDGSDEDLGWYNFPSQA